MLHTHRFMLTAILVSVTLGACAADQDRGREIEVTAQDVAKLPDGQNLTLDLRGNNTYLINVSQPADQSRIVLERSDRSVNLRDYLDETGLMNSSHLNLVEEEGSCPSGWELQCSGGRCCTVCQDDGKIGACA